MTNDETTLRPDDLPATLRAFLAAHAAREVDAAARVFTPDAVVRDQGETFHGPAGVRDFLTGAGAEFTYTSEVVGARRGHSTGQDDGNWVALVRLEGDFPGGVADLDYRFRLVDGLVAELEIG